ncbi:MAG TPA: hypothetical protein PKD52_12055 [Clostridiales bacterium]|nr:hypothetical protein [Clostridiales bacterium]
MQKRKYFRVLAFVFVTVLALAALTVLPHAETEPTAETATDSAYDADTATDPTADTAVTEEQNTEGIDDTEVDPDGADETTDSQETLEQTNTDGEGFTNQYVYEDDTIIVTAVLANNTLLPAYAQFCVTPVTEETDSIAYQEVKDEITEGLKDQNQVVAGFLAYDICFMADGVEYEPADGTVTVTIQYKNHLLKQTVVDTAEEVKMLHLKEADSGVEVEDLTEQTSISTVPETITTNTTTTSAMTEPETKTVNSTVQFVTESFSTFAITGVVTGTTPSVAVNMQFLTTAGAVDTGVNGTYYLYINRGGYRHTLTLNVAAGVATATLNGLYDQNGNKQNNNQGGLYPLTNNANYTAILFSYSGSNPITPNGFRWDENNYASQGYTKYETGATINEAYSVTAISSTVAIANNTGTFTITATEKAGTKYTSAQLLGALASVQPYGVFTNSFDLVGDMEGNIAALQANLGANFGLSSNNRNNSFSSSSHNFTVNKTYTGTTPKTFTFGLYKNGVQVNTATLTLPTTAGETTGSVTFHVNDGEDGYTVSELNSDGEPMNIGDKNNGYTLTDADSSTTSSSSQNSTSYIKTINSSGLTALRNGTETMKNNLVVGSGYTVTSNGNTLSLKQNGLTKMNADKRYCSIEVANGAFPIDFSAVLNNMAALSTSLATAVTSDTVMVKNITYSEFNKANGNALTFNTNGKMLLFNIDATGSSDISLRANAAFKVNGVSCAGYSPQAGNIIINIYTKSGDSYIPYSGAINNAGFVMGTLLAPNARVNSVSQNYNGTIVADYVKNQGGEIHGNAVSGITIDTVCDFVNTEISDANYNLPEAGGSGSYLFYWVGLALVTTAATGLFCLHHKSRKRARPKRSR